MTTELPVSISGAKQLIEWASKLHTLFLITHGVPELQTRKIDSAGIRSQFASIEIVGNKTVETFKNAIELAGVRPEDTWVIGDSVKSDINPGIAAKARCILFQYHHPHYRWTQEQDEASMGADHLIAKAD